jgi:hypothetical protein
MMWCLRRDSHSHCPAFETGASAVGLRRGKGMALPAGLCRSGGWAKSAPHRIEMRYRAQRSPATSAFEARRSIHGATGAKKWQPRVGSHHQPSGSEPDAPRVELRGRMENDPPTGVARFASLPMTCAALCALAESKMVRPAGNAPALSSPPDWRIAFFLWPDGGAPRTRTG